MATGQEILNAINEEVSDLLIKEVESALEGMRADVAALAHRVEGAAIVAGDSNDPEVQAALGAMRTELRDTESCMNHLIETLAALKNIRAGAYGNPARRYMDLLSLVRGKG